MANEWFDKVPVGRFLDDFIINYRLFSENSSKYKNDKIGFVYIIQCDDYYKIGSATHINKRISAYKTHNPYKTEVIECIYVEKYKLFEFLLHQTVKSFKHQGEWFKLSNHALSVLTSITKYYGK